MKAESSSAMRSVGSRVPVKPASPVPFLKSAITTETGSCCLGSGGVRVSHQVPATTASIRPALAAISRLLKRGAMGIGSPASSSAPSAPANSDAVWNRAAGSSIEAVHDHRSERVRNRRFDGLERRQPLVEPALHGGKTVQHGPARAGRLPWSIS